MTQRIDPASGSPRGVTPQHIDTNTEVRSTHALAGGACKAPPAGDQHRSTGRVNAHLTSTDRNLVTTANHVVHPYRDAFRSVSSSTGTNQSRVATGSTSHSESPSDE